MNEPSKEALEAAREFGRKTFNADKEGAEAYTAMIRTLALDLDRFRAEERERCAKIADADAENGRRDLDDPELEGLARARVLAAKRIAWRIRSGEQP